MRAEAIIMATMQAKCDMSCVDGGTAAIYRYIVRRLANTWRDCTCMHMILYNAAYH